MSTLVNENHTVETGGHGVHDYLSPSRLNLWLRCPLAWKLRYIDGIRPATTPSLFLGQRVHAALEHVYRHKQLGICLNVESVTKQIADNWDAAVADEEMAFASSGEEQKLRQQAVSLVTAYLSYVPQGEPKPLAVETRLECPLIDPSTGEDLGIPLVGIVDLVLPSEHGQVICDFKTAGNSKPPLEITHEIQLSSYSYLFRRTSGQQEAGLEIRSLIKTKTPQIAFHRYRPRHDAHFRRLFAVIRAYLDDLHSGRFVYRPGWGCSWCDYRDTHCRSWCG